MNRLACVIGSAACWHDDFQAFRAQHGGPFDVIAVNDAGWLYRGPIKEWVTLHPERFGDWLRKRTPDHGPVGRYWTSLAKQHRLADLDIAVETCGHWGPGSSSLFGVTVAQTRCGYERTLLCGVPMESSPHAEGASEWDGEPWPEREVLIHREGWEFHRSKLGGVRSMSGWTRELLGGPDGAFFFDRTPLHATMSERTVLPAMNGDGVSGAYWHCPACGDTTIHRLRESARAYHCTACGRDFEVVIRPTPWWARDDLSAYPVNLTGA